MLALMLLACGSTDPAPTAAPAPVSETAPQPEYWEIVGRVTPGTSPWPDAPPFEGGKAMVARCKERRPCAAERWRSTSGETMDLLLLERTIHFEDGRPAWPARWMSITGVLRSCMETPSPSRRMTLKRFEPSRYRATPRRGQSTLWKEPCGLVGLLELDAKSDDINLAVSAASLRSGQREAQCALPTAGRASAKENREMRRPDRRP